MRVLVACEFSGTVRDAFRALGHDAVSSDLLPTETPGPHHQGDVREILGDGWDLMVAHPPCTYISTPGARWLYVQPTRWQDLIDGAVFFRELLEAPIPRVAVENPPMIGWASKIVGRKSDQVIHPWQFGHAVQKPTALWIRGLPPLLSTEDVRDVMKSLPVAQQQALRRLPPSDDRWKLRSVTFPGIAAAMAEQWGGAS